MKSQTTLNSRSVYKPISLRNSKCRSSHQRCSVKKVFLEISQNSQENTCAKVSFFIKLQASGLQLYQKRDPGTGVFLWILWNFQGHLFYRTPLDDCLCKSNNVRLLWLYSLLHFQVWWPMYARSDQPDCSLLGMENQH